MNHIALNQTILKKYAVFGQGFKGGEKKYASKTPRGYYVWINGYHDLPEHSEIIQHFELGSFEYPNLMTGMGDCSGEIKYWIAITEWEYLLLVGVSLNADDSEDYAVDVAALVFKDRVPMSQKEQEENLAEIAGELLIAHYTHFLDKEEIAEFKTCVQESNKKLLISVINFFEENFEEEVNQTLKDDKLTDEEQRISDEMDKFFEGNDPE